MFFLKKYLSPINWKFTSSVAIVFVVFLVNTSILFDPDFGWHLQAGNYILSHGVPHYDVYTYTASHFEWINHEWLSDVITALLYNIGGFYLLAIVFAAIWTLGIFLASRLYDEVVLVATSVSILSFSFVRPSAWSLVFFALLQRLLESSRKNIVWFIPLLILLWSNMHGSFILGLGVLLFYKIIKEHTIPWYVIGLSVLATCINPYGFKVYIEIFRTVFDSNLHVYVSEWKRFAIPQLYYVTIIPLLGILLATKKFTWKNIISLPMIFLLMSLSSIRYYLFFSAEMLKHFEYALADLRTSLQTKLKKWEMIYISFGLALGLAAGGIYNTTGYHVVYPEKEIDFIKANNTCSTIFNYYNYGGYLIWKLPTHKVYIDGRMPSWKLNGEDYFKNYNNILKDKDYRAAEFKKHSIDCVLFSTYNKQFISDLKNEGWITAFEEKDIILLTHKK